VKIDDFSKLSQLGFPKTEEDQLKAHAFLRNMGIDPANLYQELEMSSRFVNTHRDTTYSNVMISLHSHDYYEALFCRSDGVEYLVGSERYRLQKGDIVFVPPGISHRPILPEKMTMPYERDVLWISREFMEMMLRLFPDETAHHRNHTYPIRTAGTRWEFLGEMFRNGVLEEEGKRPGWETAVLGNTMTILANLKRAYIERTAGTMQAEKPELLDRITAYIEQYYTDHITVDDLAKAFYVSNSTISHQFKQKMGVSVYRYITQRRLIAAKKLIAEKVPMEEISRRVGFVDYSTFYRAFKQEYGIAPRRFAQL
jgi:AraC-like DNA-binding protein